jgi:hypothetical protein
MVDNKIHVTKRGLREPDGRAASWLSRTPEDRLTALEAIRQSHHADATEQTFPRVYRITRKARR